MNKKGIWCLLLVLAVSSRLFGQVSFEATASKNELGINERLRVEFTMNTDGDNFKPPSFDGFRVVAGPNQSVSNMFINGKRSFSKSYTYFLTPLKKGTTNIGQASIEIDGNVYKTSPVKVVVKDAVAIPKNPNDPNYIASENLHLVAELSKNNVYINEPITVVYKLYFGGKVRPSDVSPIDMPEYKDFWSQDIPSRRTIDREMYKGKLYNFVAWQQTVLYPQRAGKLPIAPLTLDVQLDVPTNRRDFFGNEIYTQVARTITAGKRTLTVLPFPEEGKPNNFNGAVGTFDLEVKTSKNVLNASESLQATVQVKGKGNLKLFSLPELVTPSALERYDPEYKEQVNTTLGGMRGNIQDTYTLVPQFQGKYPIPPVRFSYFDPSAKSYKTLTSKEVVIDVIEGPKSIGTTASNATTINAVEVPAISNAFQFIAQRANFKPITAQLFIGSLLFYALLLIPILLLSIYLLLRKRTPDAALMAQRHKAKLAKKYLGKAKRNMSDATDFYVALEGALHNYVKARLHIQTADFSKEKMEALLTEKGVDKQTVALFIQVLTNCEFARYTPSSRSSMEQDYATAVEAITQMDKQF
ncbi:MAG: Uncharacterised protein [Bacteroidota bacterium]|nr:MAG: Uncharacterised protein [Bacteroidota bacterium]